MSVPIKPMADYIVVQAEEAQTRSASGLYLPDSAQEKPKSAKVVVVGKAVTDIKVGDKVIYKNDYEATKVTIDKKDYTLVFNKNIVATVK